MSKLRLALLATTISAGMGATGALAMPISNLGSVDIGPTAEKAAMVCNRWGRCWWRPGYYAYGYYPYYRPRFYGYYGPGWRWRHRW